MEGIKIALKMGRTSLRSISDAINHNCVVDEVLFQIEEELVEAEWGLTYNPLNKLVIVLWKKTNDRCFELHLGQNGFIEINEFVNYKGDLIRSPKYQLMEQQLADIYSSLSPTTQREIIESIESFEIEAFRRFEESVSRDEKLS